MSEVIQLTPEATLNRKMALVLGKMNRVPKNGENTHFKYKYATESDIADAVRTAMAEENLCLFVEMLEVRQEGNKTRAVFQFTFACGDTGATKSCRWEAEASDNQDKGINKVATAALKYFLLKTFIISTGNPEDDSDSGPATTPARQPIPQRPPNQPDPLAGKRLEAVNLGNECYADEWPERQIELCKAISVGHVQSVDGLNQKELETLIIGIQKKLAEAKADKPAQPTENAA